MFKREIKRPQKPMPEYQVFPPGFWHAIAAVMLMIFCVSFTGVLIFYFIDLGPHTKNIAFIELGITVALGLVLSHLTFMTSRGSIFSNALLLKFNRLCIFILVIGNIVALISGDYENAVLAAVGLALGLLAHHIYLSEQYLKLIEYYETIWAHYRWNRRTK